MMKVEQMINTRGNGAMNQFVITSEDKTVFQSYESMIVTMDYPTKTITIGRDYDYSKTTGKHRNIFFNDYANLSGLATKKGLDEAIKNGSYGSWIVKMES